MTSLAVTVVGRDRRGIVARVSGAIADMGGNLQDSSMTILRGHFAMTLVADVADAAALSRRLEPLGAQGLSVSVIPVEDEPDRDGAAERFVLSVHGADRPGIVSSTTQLIADRGGNITSIATRLSADLYVLTAEVDLPHETDVPALQAELSELAGSLGVAAGLRPADGDVL